MIEIRPIPRPQKAITIKEIKGACIKTIPIGTELTVTYIHNNPSYSACQGLEISQIWNDEYKLIKEK